jgi:hypothetical protein
VPIELSTAGNERKLERFRLYRLEREWNEPVQIATIYPQSDHRHGQNARGLARNQRSNTRDFTNSLKFQRLL